MTKIGTVHVEIKPVLNEEALAAMTDRIEQAVAQAVARGLSYTSIPGLPASATRTSTQFDRSLCPCSPSRGGSGVCNCTLSSPTITC